MGKLRKPKPYRGNPRRISPERLAELKGWLAELGDISGVVHDLNSNELIGGNQRANALNLFKQELTIVKEYQDPTPQGTVALGYYIIDGECYSYRAVRWTKEQCRRANVIANKAGGSWDFDLLFEQFTATDLLTLGWEAAELYEIGVLPIEEFTDEELDEDRGESEGYQFKISVGNSHLYMDVLKACSDQILAHPEWEAEIAE